MTVILPCHHYLHQTQDDSVRRGEVLVEVSGTTHHDSAQPVDLGVHSTLLIDH